MRRRTFLAAATAGLIATPAVAQQKPVRIIVAFAPGGPVDSVARIIAGPLGEVLGRTVIVENKPGANGVIGAEEVRRAPADGSTLWLTSVGAAAINSALYDHLQYEMMRDFAPVSLVVNNVEVLVVNPSDKAQTASAFVASAKATADTPMASSGVGSVPHLAIEQLAAASGATFLHVPYKGAAPALTDLMGGRVAGFFGDVPGLIGFVKAGRLRAIGVAAAHRTPALPDVPTFLEQGLAGIDTNNWYGVFVAAKTPPETIAGLNKAIRTVLEGPAGQALLALGTEPAPSSPAELAALVQSDTAKWGALIKAKGIQGE